MIEPKLVLNKISYVTFGKVILEHLTLSLGEKSIGIIGKNGSGKSTLAKILCGLIDPSSGELEVYTAGNIKSYPGLDVGIVFQNLALFPHLNVHENLRFGLPPNHSINKISEMLELVGLKDFGTRKIQNLSGGCLLYTSDAADE